MSAEARASRGNAPQPPPADSTGPALVEDLTIDVLVVEVLARAVLAGPRAQPTSLISQLWQEYPDLAAETIARAVEQAAATAHRLQRGNQDTQTATPERIAAMARDRLDAAAARLARAKARVARPMTNLQSPQEPATG